MYRIRHSVLLLALCVAPVFAAQPVQRAAIPPAWEQLSQAERELLVAPVRERWNANPAQRARMLDHAQRWQTMTPEQRERAHDGLKRWSHMDTEKRQEMRALFHKMRTLDPEQRKALREQWKAMTPEQRETWLRQNAPQQQK